MESEKNKGKPDLPTRRTAVSGEELKRRFNKLIKRYIKNDMAIHCPKCGTFVDTLIISGGRPMCPFCQKKNILESFAVLARMPEGRDKVHAVFATDEDKEHPENNMTVTAPTYDKKGKIKSFGKLTMPVSDTLLKDPEEFKKAHILMLTAVDRAFFEDAFKIKLNTAPKKDSKNPSLAKTRVDETKN